MAIAHILESFAVGGVTGLQASQRDWSPYVVHFTSWAAMGPIRTAIKDVADAKSVRQLLAEADESSCVIAEKIGSSSTLRASSPSGKDEVPACVCLSECTIGGLISHAERFGRFGIVLRKCDFHAAGGRPCVYVDRDCYGVIADIGRGKDVATNEGKLFGLANVYSPPGAGQIQDFTHEREWRHFGSIDLSKTVPVALLCPRTFVGRVRAAFGGIDVVIPIDEMFRWGA